MEKVCVWTIPRPAPSSGAGLLRRRLRRSLGRSLLVQVGHAEMGPRLAELAGEVLLHAALDRVGVVLEEPPDRVAGPGRVADRRVLALADRRGVELPALDQAGAEVVDRAGLARELAVF